MLALSDLLPAMLSDQPRSHWIKRDPENSEVDHVCWSLRHSAQGEGLLTYLPTRLMLHIGLGLAERALNFVAGNKDATAILYHPSAEVRAEQAQFYAGNPSVTVVDTLEEAAAVAKATPLCCYIRAEDFALADVERLIGVMNPQVLVGGFDGRRYPSGEVYRTLAGQVPVVRLTDISNGAVLHWLAPDPYDVSVVVPLFNVEAHIGRCLDSLLDQGSAKIEIVVVNDGSSDGGPDIVRRYQDDHDNIQLIDQANAGVGAARAVGAAAARGRYIGLTDADDWVSGQMFEKLFGAALATNSDVAMCGFVEEYQASGTRRPVDEHFQFTGWDATGHQMLNWLDVMLQPPSIWRKIYRRQFLKRNSVTFNRQIRRYDDLLFNAEVMLASPRIVRIPGNYYHYLLEREGQTVGFRDERLFVHFDIFRALRSRVESIGRRHEEIAFRRLQIGTHFWVDSLLSGALQQRYRKEVARDLFDNHMFLDDRMICKLAREAGGPQEQFVRQALAVR